MKQDDLELLNESLKYSLKDLCELCSIHAEGVIEMVEFGIIQPIGDAPKTWIFPASAVVRIQKTIRLKSDLDINLSGVALSLELLDEINELRYQNQELLNRLNDN